MERYIQIKGADGQVLQRIKLELGQTASISTEHLMVEGKEYTG